MLDGHRLIELGYQCFCAELQVLHICELLYDMSPRISGTSNGGFPEPYLRLFWGWVFPYRGRIHYIGEDSSILGTNVW